ncbi:Ig-like domain-containing protein [Thalassomonas sp. M1454]|uniref:Ig-like domain-containing protein n=1 Tax=Thalassomonas sp. M1454 TaxID=2594477 RepID=UPI00118132A4|nr:Ig-like domain-containing protein [Thalassomonas sp. M1454]TRX55885.1 hypothetical protein FNN08_09735 [Thalassomonas sp. M1454]
MKNYNLLPLSFLSLALTACGGSSSNSEVTNAPDTQPVVNTAPTAEPDQVVSLNGNTVNIDVLNNDIDADGDTLTISDLPELPKNGSAVIDGNQVVYTPLNGFAGVDSFSYQISDGNETVSSIVTIDVNHELTVQGQVTDSPIANATVVVKIGGDKFTTTADQDGFYSIDLLIKEINKSIILTAQGNALNNQDNVELLLFLGNSSELLEQTNELHQVDNELLSTNVTHVSTALYLLAKDLNDDNEFSNFEEFSELTKNIDTEKLIETSALIKLLVDNPAYEIPEGETIVSLLDPEQGESNTEVAIDAYLTSTNNVDETGKKSDSFLQDLDVAIKETIADPKVVLAFTEEILVNQSLAVLNDTKAGWVDFVGDILHFSANAIGTEHKTIYRGTSSKQGFDWKIIDGKLNVEMNSYEGVYFEYSSYPFDNLISNGFNNEVQTALVNAVDSGKLPSDLQFEMRYGFDNKKYTILSKTPETYKVFVEGEYQRQLIMPDGIGWNSENPIATEATTATLNLLPTAEVSLDTITADNIEGDWVLHFNAEVYDYSNLQESTESFIAQVLTFSNGKAIARESGVTYDYSLENGSINLTSDNLKFVIKPIQKEDNLYLAYTEELVDNQVKSLFVAQMAKFDNTYLKLVNNLVTELPQIQLANINGYLEGNWQGDLPTLDAIWGYQFKEDGTLRRGVSGILAGENYDDIDVDHYNLGDNRWTWDKSENIINLRFNDDGLRRHRTWEVISVDDNGKALVMEYSTLGYDQNNDFMVTEDEIGAFIYPRINHVSLFDLSNHQDAWKNTNDYGLLNLEGKKSLSEKRNATFK